RDGVTGANINGHPCLDFNGTDQLLGYGANYPLSGKTDAEIFIVLKMDADPAASAATSGLWLFNNLDFDAHHPYTDGQIYESWGRANRVVV
ncbi:MAG: hypothetical protein GWN18_03155, partial [Thermoplasmata archaeon]|nr:hypothetical protein [Thermoplasmata archaeon]NIS11023.1 hypothetical protein [Thermoplasmata archaeon]NIS18955.1 hypothetical protein [Thermoplasmata archaeon]NIT76004.1 hypothetical protein [Thermoplasmata archaeon]NIU48105.1 hypothetical protein [Thermoplasmata archaeon]